MINALFLGAAAQAASRATQAEMAAGRAAAGMAETRSQVETMQADVERLLMITEALWGLLRDEHGYTEEQLVEKVQEIDLRDGRLDGRVAKQAPAKCPQCGRAVSARRPACIFCGAPVGGDPFAR